MSHLHSLSIFVTVVEEGSFSAAAKKLGLTQPTISFHIDNLEKDFGCLLFMRTAKGVELTVYGHKLHENAHKIQQMLEEAHNQIKSLVAGNSGCIVIGASTIPSEYILPSLLAKFLHQHPGVKISIETGDSETILSGFKESRYPIAFIGTKPEKLPSLPIWHDELVLFIHPELSVEFKDITAMQDIPLVMRKAPSGTRKTILDALAVAGLNPENLNIVLEVTGNEALKAAVLNKAGAGLISRWAIQDDLTTGRLKTIPLPNFQITRTFHALHHESLMPTCVKLLWEYLLENKNSK